MEKMAAERWIGLLEIQSAADGVGAFCTSVAWARNPRDFEHLAHVELERLGYKLISIEEVELYSARIQSFEVSEECRTLAESVCSEVPIQFCRFHTYTGDE